MIKRRPNLSAAHGGTVTEVEVGVGSMKRITTYCRIYQHHPHNYGIVCRGYFNYPPCPDFERCQQNPKPKPGSYEAYVSDG